MVVWGLSDVLPCCVVPVLAVVSTNTSNRPSCNRSCILHRMDTNRRLALLLWLRRRRQRKAASRIRKRFVRWWVHPINQLRKTQGAFHNLVEELREDDEKFFNFHRLTPPEFDELLALVESKITKQHLTREPLSAALRLSLTLRYLASGDSMVSLSYLYRVGKSTVPKVVFETTEAIWTALSPLVLPEPSVAIWKQNASEFAKMWNFPNCIGALDGKHVVVQCFKNSGSEYFNYKHQFSVVLLGICDPNLKFTYVSIGSAGRESDGGIFQRTELGRQLLTQTLPLPPLQKLPGTNIRLPHVIVADAAFPLLMNVMRPYPGTSLPADRIIFNYRLSRARRTIENTFGVLAARWRIFRKPIIASEPLVKNIIKACVVLHNWLRDKELQISPSLRHYIPPGFVDQEDSTGRVEEGRWRLEPQAFSRSNIAGNARNYTQAAKEIREQFTKYFMTNGAVPWQWEKLPRIGTRPFRESDEEFVDDDGL